MAERGISVDHAIIHSPWPSMYLYRAIDSNSDSIEFWFSERRNLAAAKRFLRRALKCHGRPERIVIDGSQTNREAILSCDMTLKFGQDFADKIRRRLPSAGEKWHLDEVVISIAGEKRWLWRAVHQHGAVLDILVQSRHNAKAAKRLLRKLLKLLKKQGLTPRVMITDKPPSYGAAKREIMPVVEHRQHKGLNNRAENSHQPTQRRERIMKRFKSAGQAQRFLSVQDQVANLFRRPANTSADGHRRARAQAFQVWADVTGVASAA